MTDQPQAPAKEDGQLHQRSRNYGKVPHAIMHDLKLTDGAVRLYAHMHWRYGSNHQNFEGRRSMAQMLGVSERTISNRTRELEAAGWIVVVERDLDAKSGNYRTPFYHVFETRKAARQFRAEYQKAGDERVRPRPKLAEDELRKSRVGKGGKPSHKPQQQEEQAAPPAVEPTPETIGTQVPQGTQVPPAIGTQVPTIHEQVYPRTEDSSIAPQNGADELPATPVLTVLPKVNPMYDAIKAVWGYTAQMNGAMAKMLTGKSTKAGWKEYNISPAATPDEVIAWAAWYRKTELNGDTKLNMLEVRMKIQSTFYRWRELMAEQDRVKELEAQQQTQYEADEWSPTQFVRKSRKENANADEPAA